MARIDKKHDGYDLFKCERSLIVLVIRTNLCNVCMFLSCSCRVAWGEVVLALESQVWYVHHASVAFKSG